MHPRDIEEKVHEICDAEGIFKEIMKPNDKFRFAFKVAYPPWHPHPKNLIVTMPKGKKFISIELATKISPPHLEAFKKIEDTSKIQFQQVFFHLMRNMLLNRNLLYTFSMKNNSYVITEHIYEDGLTLDNFYRQMRKVYFASISAQIMLNDVVSGKFKGMVLPSSKIGTSEEGQGSPEDLYYS